MQEVGARIEKGGLIFTGVYWWSKIDSELIYVGDQRCGGAERSGQPPRL